MNQQALIKYWKHLNYEYCVQTGMHAPEDAQDLVSDTKYEPIDVNFCIATTDGTSFFLTAANGQITNAVETCVI